MHSYMWKYMFRYSSTRITERQDPNSEIKPRMGQDRAISYGNKSHFCNDNINQKFLCYIWSYYYKELKHGS